MKILSHEHLDQLRDHLTLIGGAMQELPASVHVSGAISALTDEYNVTIAKIQFLEKFLDLDTKE